MVHISDSGSSEVQSPEDTRFPNDKFGTLRNDSSTIRLESPRQTQYAFRNIDLAAREARRHRAMFPEVEPEPLHGIFNADSWNGGGAANGPVGLNPLINNNINVNGFDTEMSDAQNNSSGLTPQSHFSYNPASSNTSYSPPNLQEDDPNTTQATSMPVIAGTMNGYMAFTPPSNDMFAQNADNGPGIAKAPLQSNTQAFGNNAQPLKQEDLFKNMQGWDMGNSPGPVPGMSPGGEWDKMMDSIGQGMNWGMTPGAERTG